jgi:hypothetical protein
MKDKPTLYLTGPRTGPPTADDVAAMIEAVTGKPVPAARMVELRAAVEAKQAELDAQAKTDAGGG